MWKNLSISACETFHVNNQGLPAYEKRFDQVLAFHSPGIAPVNIAGKAWHIRADGSPVYDARFDKTFGFYCGVAAVVNSNNRWFHILPTSEPLYGQRYDWVGNFQSNLCAVRDQKGDYFHIDLGGNPISGIKWSYCGDFRDGIAVVQHINGLCTHILTDGDLLHGVWFDDLDVFHKGYARARFSNGWAHINRKGDAIYSSRYKIIEPFYNGFSRVEQANGSRLVINEQGYSVQQLRPATQNYFGELSGDLVGYWRTLAIGTAAELGVFDALPGKTSSLASLLSLNSERLFRLLKALGELGLVTHANDEWLLTVKGQFLNSSHPKTLVDAAIEYSSDLLERWNELPNLVRGCRPRQDIFHSVAKNDKRRVTHHRMLRSYALHDYQCFIAQLEIQKNEIVMDAAGGTGSLAQMIATEFPKANIVVTDLPEVVNDITVNPLIQKQAIDLFKPWPIKAHHIFLARVLHDWNDHQAGEILNNASNALLPNGKVYIMEMLQSEDLFDGALCDLHLLTVTGGSERTEKNYQSLLLNSGLLIHKKVSGTSLVSMLIAGRQVNE